MAQTDVSKTIQYLNKDFVSFRNALMNFSKVYYPNSYKDFSESTLGMMFMEMSSYVGDVLSYYMDSNLKESMMIYAEENKNVLYLAQSLGYKNKTTVPALTTIDIFQQIPAKYDGSGPDLKYAAKIDANMQIQSSTSANVSFRVLESIDFSNYQTQNYFPIVHRIDQAGNPLVYLIRKTVPAIAGTISTTYFDFGNTPEQFASVIIPYNDVVEILDVYDSDGNKWYEVNYLAQDTVFIDEINELYNNNLTTESERLESPYILKLKRVSRRFTTKKLIDGTTSIQFGAGISAYPDQTLIPTTKTVNEFLAHYSFTDVSANFLNTRTYGLMPSNTQLTVRFTRGGGIDSNVPQGDLTGISTITYIKTEDDFLNDTDKEIYAQSKNTIYVTNPEPATGGRGAETTEEIRQNALAYFAAQDRCVTYEDYITRILALPAKYGNVSKAFIQKTNQNFSIDLYVLGYDYRGKLSQLSDTVKNNIIQYLSYYRELTTAVNIKDAFVVNIGINFSILTYPKYNKNEVILSCINELTNYFNIDNWQINQPIVLSDIYRFLDQVEGVRTVVDVTIYNKYSTVGVNEYENNFYDIKAATLDEIIYPSLDPMMWEIRYPNIDIVGMAK